MNGVSFPSLERTWDFWPVCTIIQISLTSLVGLSPYRLSWQFQSIFEWQWLDSRAITAAWFSEFLCIDLWASNQCSQAVWESNNRIPFMYSSSDSILTVSKTVIIRSQGIRFFRDPILSHDYPKPLVSNFSEQTFVTNDTNQWRIDCHIT